MIPKESVTYQFVVVSLELFLWFRLLLKYHLASLLNRRIVTFIAATLKFAPRLLFSFYFMTDST